MGVTLLTGVTLGRVSLKAGHGSYSGHGSDFSNGSYFRMGVIKGWPWELLQ